MEQIETDRAANMDELYGDESYYNYSRLMHGSYIGALMQRAQEIERLGGSIQGGAKTRDQDVSASTLSPAVREAFRESQKDIEWKGPDSIIGAGVGVGVGAGKESDFGDIEESVAPASQDADDFASVEELPEDAKKNTEIPADVESAFGSPDERDFESITL
jgi:hypothetical protein